MTSIITSVGGNVMCCMEPLNLLKSAYVQPSLLTGPLVLVTFLEGPPMVVALAVTPSSVGAGFCCMHANAGLHQGPP